MFLKNQKGQGLVEYLLILCLMAVACIGALRSINHVVNARFVEVDYALRGVTKKVKKEAVDNSLAEKRDLSNFMKGAGSRDKR